MTSPRVTLPDPLRRAARTFLQSFLAVFLAQWGAVAANGIPSYSVFTSLVVAAGVAGLIAVLSWLQNALEDSGVVKPLLKDAPSAPEPPNVRHLPPAA